MSGPPSKKPYVIPCASRFRDEVLALADRKRVNTADIARSILLTLPLSLVREYPDPGGPPVGDRERITVGSGPSAGRVLVRKPRLQMRLPAGLEPSLVRRGLAFALALDRGDVQLVPPAPSPSEVDPGQAGRIKSLEEENERLMTLVSVLSFDLLPEGPRDRAEALYVLGFTPGATPSRMQMRAKFTMLASIHHPDSEYGDHARMSQLNIAMDLLRR
ncbi:MAG: J domain-containing protein [Rhodospirillales bacterium]|nr:J domain-containing protein [Rhodospirillales bacterium]